MFEWEAPEPSLVSRITAAIKRKKRVENERSGLKEAIRALYGPPSTPDELAEARSRIAAQAARDRGQSGLF
jgi:hypothetical protein